MADNDEGPATEGDRAWREQTQETEEQAEELEPPHEPGAERGDPSPQT